MANPNITIIYYHQTLSDKIHENISNSEIHENTYKTVFNIRRHRPGAHRLYVAPTTGEDPTLPVKIE